jgi:hypothetical protein
MPGVCPDVRDLVFFSGTLLLRFLLTTPKPVIPAVVERSGTESRDLFLLQRDLTDEIALPDG